MDFTFPGVREKIAFALEDGINEVSKNKRVNRHSVRVSPSMLGGTCTARLWYQYRWAKQPKPIEGRQARYNSRGDKEEEHIAGLMREAGWTVDTVDPETNEQFGVTDIFGHLYGKTDGRASHPEHTNGLKLLFECKYINTKRFIHLTSKPLIEADPKYYGQVCLYMMLRDLPAALFVPVNRNDDDIKPKVIPRDDDYARDLLRRAETIVNSKVRPARVAESPAFFECKSMCDYTDICHFATPVDINCRACVNCTAIEGGRFKCDKWNAVIPDRKAIEAACPSFSPIV